nr:immunoglobulin heavy chain junction region [Macaca mulatta]
CAKDRPAWNDFYNYGLDSW